MSRPDHPESICLSSTDTAQGSVGQISAEGPRMDQYLCYLNVFMCKLNDAALLLNLKVLVP